MSTRVHEIAKEHGVESRQVLDKFKQLGIFVKSASSQVHPYDEARLRYAIRVAGMAGATPAEWFAIPLPPGPHPSKPSRRPRRVVEKPAPRETSWTGSKLGADGERVWRQAGLGDLDEPLAWFLLEHGVLPEDLKVPIRGTAAVNRLRSGEASWHVLIAELKEARSSVPAKRRELPSTKVVRRYKGA